MADSITTLPQDMKARLKSAYDAIAPTYNSKLGTVLDHIRLDYLTRLLTLLTATKQNDAKVLELGCGAGMPSTKTLLEHPNPKAHVIANDLSTTQIALAQENLKEFVDQRRLELVQGDMLALDFPDSTFDAVTGFYSIIHLPREEQTQLIQKIARWLKPGGYFLANFAQEELEHAVMEEWLGEKEGWMYWSAWGTEGSLKMIEEAGLEVVVKEVRESDVDATFLWVIAKKGGSE